MDADGTRRPNRLKRMLAEGRLALGATLTMNSPETAEIFSHMGFDWLWIETDHSSLDSGDVFTMLQATNGSDTSIVVRVPWNDKTLIKRALDAGPDGIIVPLVNCADEAEEAVRAIKYPPVGERGAGLSRAQGYGRHMGEYLATANDEIITIVMIEHITAVENIEEILAVPGVDSVMVGALDLSGSMGLLGQTDDPAVESAVQRVLAACQQLGVPCGTVAMDPEVARRRIAEGFTNVIVGMDVLFLAGAAQAALDRVRA
jgi:2-keto-3-deoxy-L-rhamnonate aldolase RhmA